MTTHELTAEGVAEIEAQYKGEPGLLHVTGILCGELRALLAAYRERDALFEEHREVLLERDALRAEVERLKDEIDDIVLVLADFVRAREEGIEGLQSLWHTKLDTWRGAAAIVDRYRPAAAQ
jgi:hypothetical protein